jgi:lipopolysaccharide biosynthesis glycosyltransferase
MTSSDLLQPAFAENNIPVVFAVDDNFIPYLSVAIESIIANSSLGCGYDLIILEEKISERNKKRLKTQIKKRNFSLRFYNTAPFFERYSNHIWYVNRNLTKATYYRFFIPHIFASYTTVAYLDCDLVVCDDIAKIYNFTLGDNLVAAAQSVSRIFDDKKRIKMSDRNQTIDEYFRDTLGLSSALEYFNSGVMLFNIQKSLDEDLLGKCLETLESLKTPRWREQDVLVSVCRGRVFTLPLCWNHLWYVQNFDFLKGWLPETIFDEYAAAWSDPKIVHYASAMRPWTSPDKKLAGHFWRHAANTPFFRKIIEKALDIPSRRLLLDMHELWHLKMEEFMYASLQYVLWGKLRKRIRKKIASLVTRRKNVERLLSGFDF